MYILNWGDERDERGSRLSRHSHVDDELTIQIDHEQRKNESQEKNKNNTCSRIKHRGDEGKQSVRTGLFKVLQITRGRMNRGGKNENEKSYSVLGREKHGLGFTEPTGG